jgi:hypothetical protein
MTNQNTVQPTDSQRRWYYRNLRWVREGDDQPCRVRLTYDGLFTVIWYERRVANFETHEEAVALLREMRERENSVRDVAG